MSGEKFISVEEVRSLLQTVTDPEVPALSVIDLGIIREIKVSGETIDIIIVPTYSGCPVMSIIIMHIKVLLSDKGFQNVNILADSSTAWTTDWITEKGRQNLKKSGIAPPNPRQLVCDSKLLMENEAVQCPSCNSWHTLRINEYGKTPCLAVYTCKSCRKTFHYFKPH